MRYRSSRSPGAAKAFGLAALVAVGLWGAAAQVASGLPASKLCKPFSGPKWVNPYPPHEVGHHYQINVVGTQFTCTTAAVYVKHFIAEKIKSTAKLGVGTGPVTGGPTGFVCSSAIGYTGTAYQGRCEAKHFTLTSSSFNWGPYNDS
jgi:hypothetical protein